MISLDVRSYSRYSARVRDTESALCHLSFSLGFRNQTLEETGYR